MGQSEIFRMAKMLMGFPRFANPADSCRDTSNFLNMSLILCNKQQTPCALCEADWVATKSLRRLRLRVGARARSGVKFSSRASSEETTPSSWCPAIFSHLIFGLVGENRRPAACERAGSNAAKRRRSRGAGSTLPPSALSEPAMGDGAGQAFSGSSASIRSGSTASLPTSTHSESAVGDCARQASSGSSASIQSCSTASLPPSARCSSDCKKKTTTQKLNPKQTKCKERAIKFCASHTGLTLSQRMLQYEIASSSLHTRVAKTLLEPTCKQSMLKQPVLSAISWNQAIEIIFITRTR